MLVVVTADSCWNNSYMYYYNPEQCGPLDLTTSMSLTASTFLGF